MSLREHDEIILEVACRCLDLLRRLRELQTMLTGTNDVVDGTIRDAA